MMEHLRLAPDETPVEYLQRLTQSLETGGCYTIEEVKVNVLMGPWVSVMGEV